MHVWISCWKCLNCGRCLISECPGLVLWFNCSTLDGPMNISISIHSWHSMRHHQGGSQGGALGAEAPPLR